MLKEYYYGVKETGSLHTGGFHGRVYYLTLTSKVDVFVGPLRRFSGNSVLRKAVKTFAISDALKWLEEYNLEAHAESPHLCLDTLSPLWYPLSCRA